ncbi:MAG: hypothetical protein IKY94_03280 [Lachnospiraceae bacterium]|nr:hypothetical protein [Lachnospiraceae bacterium]
MKKLGVYDLVAVLLTGICINILIYSTIIFLFPDIASKWIVLKNIVFFLVFSYLVGIVVQEIGSFINSHIFDKKNKLLEKVFDGKEKYSLTEKERNEVQEIVKEELDFKEIPNEEICYNYCRYYLMKYGSMARTDKDQSIAGMSRGLAIYFFLNGIFLFCYAILNEEIGLGIIVISLLSLVLGVLLYYRNIRFVKMRYLNIMRAAYYNYRINGRDL